MLHQGASIWLFMNMPTLGTAFWTAFNYVHHCTVVDAMRGQS
jgi:hypothetical protein